MTNLNVKMKDQAPADENLGSFYMGRMRPSQPARRVLPKGALTIVMLFAFAAIIWYAYPRGQERYSDIDIPVITADKATYKFKPEDPGGMEVPHQDSTVFDPLVKKSPDTVDRVLPKPEEPTAKAEALKAAPIDKPDSLELQSVSRGAEKLISTPVAKPAPVKKAAAKPAAPTPKVVEAKPAAPAKVTAVAKPAAQASKATPVKTAAVAPVARAAAKTSAVPATSGFYMQFGAYRTTKDAQEDWSRLQKKFPQLLTGLSMRTQEVKTPKGTLTRLQAGRVTESRAKEICAGMQAAKAACILIR